MPWAEVSTVALREEFVQLAQQEGGNRRELCRRYGISPTIGYTWLHRFAQHGVAGLTDQSRRPHTSPRQTPSAVEAAVVALREAHPAWGPRKLHRRLQDMGVPNLPNPSTIGAILRRHGRIDPAVAAQHQAGQRFEAVAPNRLWQVDFKGAVALHTGSCHPLSVLDDHSRFAVDLIACADERGPSARAGLTRVFRRAGIPERLLLDNGAAWRGDWATPLAALILWLLRLGIVVSHGRPAHPQTQGKVERFHRTLQAELLQARVFADLPTAQAAFDDWRLVYNTQRPHQALELATPITRYCPSPRAFPEVLPPIVYGPDDLVRKVGGKGEISVHGRPYRIGKAFTGLPVTLRPTLVDGVFSVHFCHQQVGELDVRRPLDA